MKERKREFCFLFLISFLFVLSALVFVLFCFLLSCIYIATSCKCHASAMQAMQCRGHGCKPGHPFQRERESVCVCVWSVKERKREFFLVSYLLFVCSFCFGVCLVLFSSFLHLHSYLMQVPCKPCSAGAMGASQAITSRERVFLFLICFLFVISALSESTAMQPN